MRRQLVPLRRYIEEMEDQGEDTETLYVDPDDVVTIEPEEEPEED